MRAEDDGPAGGDHGGGDGPQDPVRSADPPLRPYGSTGEARPAPEPDPSLFRSPARRVRPAVVAVRVAILGSVLEAAAGGWALAETTTAIDDEPTGDRASLDTLDLPQSTIDALNRSSDAASVVTGLSLLALVVAVVLVLRWQSVAVRNQRAFGVHPRYSAAAAAWSWFVPIWSFFGPKTAYNDLWRSAEPDGEGPFGRDHWRDRAVPQWFLVWWLLWLVATALETRGAAGAEDTLADRERLLALTTAGAVCTVLASVLFLRILRRITERQDARAAELAPATATGPTSEDAAGPPPGA